VAACRPPPLGTQSAWGRSEGMAEPAMELIWDLLIFLVLVAVGLVVLSLLARTR
jgi:hypothetical protein